MADKQIPGEMNAAIARIPGDPLTKSARATNTSELRELQSAISTWVRRSDETSSLAKAILEQVKDCRDTQKLKDIMSFLRIADRP